MQTVKVVTVGDGAVGKSCFLITWSTKSFPGDYVPTVFDNYGNNIMVDGTPINVSLWDTAGQEDYDRLRPLSYPQTDVFFVCYSIDGHASFQNIRQKWIPEVRHYCPNTPIVLLGLKSDLRKGNQEGEREVVGYGGSFHPQVTQQEGRDLAREIGCAHYYEVSALHQRGVDEAMMSALRTALNDQSKMVKGKRFRWPWKRSRTSSSVASSVEPSIPLPPELPANEKAPWINIPSSTLASDWAKLINKPEHSDVTFELGPTTFYAHRYVLCTSSNIFRAIFGMELSQKTKVKSLSKSFMWDKDRLANVSMETANVGYVEGILSVQAKSNDSGDYITTSITLDPTYFTEEVLSRCLSFLYTGIVDLNKDSDQLAETITAAHFLNLPELVAICENASKEEEFLNPSIGTWLNDRNNEVTKQIFFNQELLADVYFRVEGQLVPAHKLVLCQRCGVMAAMLTGGFKESHSNEVEIPGVTLDTFLALLEYLYTDHVPIEKGDAVGILALSNQYAVCRLMALCELYISKEVERLTAKSITHANLDVIALLLGIQFHNADQLSSWCLHFISSNYLAYVEQESFSMLQDENLDHVTTHRWPPVSYEQEMQEYRIKYLEEEGEEGEEKKEKGRRKKFSLRGRMNHLF